MVKNYRQVRSLIGLLGIIMENIKVKKKQFGFVLEDVIFDTLDFLTILDETGVPLYARSKHGVSEIDKVDGNINGKKVEI